MKKFALLTRFICFSACVFVVTAVNAQNLVNDPGFEASTDVTGHANPFSSAWTVVDDTSPGFPPGTDGSDSNVGADAAFAHSGTNFANLGAFGSLGSLSQTLATAPGGTYNLSFWLASDSGFPPNEFDVFWNGTQIYSAPNTASFAYTQFSFNNLAATGNSTTLEFRYQNDADYFRLDDVTASVVPELSVPSFALLGFGLLGLMALRRRKVSA
jgi:hypothetical protein